MDQPLTKSVLLKPDSLIKIATPNMDNKSNEEYIHLEFDKSQRSSDNTTSQAYTGKYDFLKLSNSKNSISRISKMLENSDL